MMNIDELKAAIGEIEQYLGLLQSKAESGADWAEICRIEEEELMPLLDEYGHALEDNSQFGVGA